MDNIFFLTAMNTIYEGGGYKFCPDATPTDEFSETEVPTIETTTKVDDVSDYVGNITLELVPGGTDEGSATVDEEKLYQELLAAAFNEAARLVDEKMSNEMSKLTSSMGLPPGMF